MIKKIALAAALAATASFATYDMFAVGQPGKGQVEITDSYTWHDHWSMDAINIKAKYNVIQNLELSLQGIGYRLWNEDDRCDDKGFDACPDNDGITALTIGARYQFMPMLIAAADIDLPLNSEDVVGDYDPLAIYAAIQYTQEFMPGLALGTEAGFKWKFEDEKKEEGLILQIMAELDYTIASIGLTPWVGLGFFDQLTETQIDGHDNGGDESQIEIWFGASYAINQMIGIKAQFTISNGDLWGDHNALKVGATINF